MKSKRASYQPIGYESEVYRVRFYGDINRVPVRVERKKAHRLGQQGRLAHDRHFGGVRQVDDYYGFEIDGNRLFLLQDMTVTHNTAFVVSAMRNAAVEFKKAVAIFSLEMSSLQLVNRLISAEAELDSEKIKKGNLADLRVGAAQPQDPPLSAGPDLYRRYARPQHPGAAHQVPPPKAQHDCR